MIHIMKKDQDVFGITESLCGLRPKYNTWWIFCTKKSLHTHLGADCVGPKGDWESLGDPTCEACILLHWADPSKTFSRIQGRSFVTGIAY